MLLAISTFVLMPDIGKAQCPDSNTPNPGPAWTPHTERIGPLPGTNCFATVTFCDRNNTIEAEWEMYITSITPDVGDSCGPYSLFKGTFDWFVNHGAAPEDLGLDTCGQSPAKTVKTWLMQCWKIQYDNPSHTLYTYFACPDNISCTASCSECIDPVAPHHIIITNCTITGSYRSTCTAAPDWPWFEGVCYDAGNMCGPN